MAKKATRKKATRKKVAVKVVKPVNPTFVYVGNGQDDPESCGYYGHQFVLNGPGVEVTDPRVLVKIRGNNHFKEL